MMRNRFITLLGTLVAAIVAACSGGESPASPEEPEPPDTLPTGVGSVSVAPITADLFPGDTVRLTATVRDANGNVLANRTVTWSSDNTGVATVSSSGLVTAIRVGGARITATADGKTGSGRMNVVVLVSGLWDFVETLTDGAGTTCVDTGTFSFVQNRATLSGGGEEVDACSNALAAARWAPYSVSVTEGSVVDSTLRFATGCAYVGTVSNGGNGPASGEVSCSVAISPPGTVWPLHGSWSAVRGAPVASVTMSPNPVTVAVGGTAQLTAELRNGSGARIFQRLVTWTSSSPTALSVANGLVRGLGVGVASIEAASGSASGTATVTASLVTYTSLSSGTDHTCGLTSSGVTLCWGRNGAGELGDGSFVSRLGPASVVGGVGFAVVRGASLGTCALTVAGAPYCWGYLLLAEVAPGAHAIPILSQPVAIGGGLAFTALAKGGGDRACALTGAGAAYCWGANTFGEVGDGTTAGRPAPVPVTGGLTFAALSVGGAHSCALTSGGTAYCWGANFAGRLGDGTTTNRSAPTAVVGGLTFGTISAGPSHSCALTTGGVPYCWGDNASGKLGDGTTTNRTAPVLVGGGLTLSAVSAGGTHTCALTSGGVAYCWGDNGAGQLGDGTATNRSAPVPVASGVTFAAVSAGGTHTCGLTSGGVAYCWGNNQFGQLGDGSGASRLTPVRVVGQP